MSEQTIQLEKSVRARIFQPLARLRARTRLYLLISGIAKFVLILLIASLLQLGLDWWFRFTLDQRAVINAIITAAWLLAIFRYIARPLLATLPDPQLARWIDAAHPDLHDHLTSAVEFAESPRPVFGSDPDMAAAAAAATDSPALVRAVLSDACELSSRLRFEDVLDHRRAGVLGMGGAAILLLIGLAFIIIPETMSTWFRRNWMLQDLPWRQSTYLVLEKFDEHHHRRYPRGDDLMITALVRADSQPPSSATLDWWTDSGRRGSETMTRVGERRFELGLGPLSENIHFRISGGDERTAEHLVIAVDRPRVVHTVARITAPQYTQLAPVELEQQTVLEILNGSLLEFRARVNKPLKSARFVAADGAEVPCELSVTNESEGPSILAKWAQPISGTYRFELEDIDGWSNRNPVRYTLKVTPDKAPRVQLQAPAVGEVITPRAEFSVDLRFEDTYGLGSAALTTQRGDDAPLMRPIESLRRAMRQFQITIPIAAASAAVQPGERLRVSARAADLDPAGPNVGEATALDLRVLSAEDFLTEMGRREYDLRREFETLVAAQRSIEETLARTDVPAAAASQQLASLARRQSAHAGRCLSFAQRFEQILVEMRTSKVARPADERRINDRIVQPLGILGRDTVPRAAEALSALRTSGGPAQRGAAQAAQAETVRQMRAVLANMLEWEGYREAVTLLQDVIATQGAVRNETVAALEKELREILEITEPDATTKPAPPAP